MEPASSCTFEGNSDIYGLGVRVGIYLQWLATLIAKYLHEPAVESTRDANTAYLVAMLAGLILITRDAHAETPALEGYITLLLCFAMACSSCSQAYSAARTRELRSLVDLLLCTAVCAYGLWFLSVGIQRLPRLDCPEVVFFFAPVALFGWFRIFLQAVFAASLAASAVLVAMRTSAIYHELADAVATWGGRAGESSPPPIHPARVVRASVFQILGGITAVAVFTLVVELTLAWNHARDVYVAATFSQLFPLVVSTTNLARVVVQLLKAVVLGDSRVEWTK
ncbi:hypothetical protein MKZ38_001009 [Zalerion maritima]|uniref:Uncharacterized protein n=1 Tax=Zalerion maritima TaxID=339359 RepID=A0AAD5RS58_9PEZI|nr:hypothetical protein MKZ38_001009 [Zalerion maritima]